MQFIDEAVIHVKAGDGGNGSAAFRREDGVPRGGPSGGDGGNGGSIVLVADPRLSSLLDFKYRRHYAAERGEDGRNKDQYGAGGEDLVLRVPVGTVVIAEGEAGDTGREPSEATRGGAGGIRVEDAEDDEAGDEAGDETDDDAGDETGDQVLADLDAPGARFVVCRGGTGGRGNIHFKTPWNQAPRTAEPGTPGEERKIRLELKLLADVGLLGYPNVGKSTFIRRVSRARPKVADYPFTTLVPNLGVVQLSDDRHFVIADIPGLIEGASEGAGLGHQFLRHVERCRVLLHIVEATFTTGPQRTPIHDFDVINAELARYAPELAHKPQVVVLNKIDATASEDVEVYRRTFAARGVELLTISAVTGAGVEAVLERLWAHLHPPRGTPDATDEARSHATIATIAKANKATHRGQ
ncbi:MAG TPA: GTPase ObgE [Kofleriaceae bacterium]|nr:GTPase ObgE [Kofleriaceae bacterium]